MGKVVKAVVGIVATVVGVVTGQWWLIAAGAALTMSSVVSTPKVTANAASEQRLSKKLEPETFRKIVFGKTAMGADMRYWEVYGPNATDYVEVIATSTHKIQGFTRFWINDDETPFFGEGPLSNGVPQPGQASGLLAGHLSRWTVKQGGVGQGQNLGGHGTWTAASSRLTGCSYYALIYAYKQEKFPQGISSRYTAEGEGAMVYDPRRDVRFGGTHVITDQNTWQYSPVGSGGQPIGRNNALQMLWYQLGWRINGKLVAGKGVDPNDIDLDSFIYAANVCEVMGWYSDMILSTGDTHKTNEGIISSGSQGELLDTGGRYSYHVAHDDTANVAIHLTDDDIIGDGFDWVPRSSMSTFYNEIAGTFTDPAALYQPRPFPMVYDQAYYDEDQRKERTNEPLAAVQSAAQAQRLMRIKLNKSRFQGEFSATFNYKAMAARNWSIVTLTIPELGWVEKMFRIKSYGIAAMNGIDLTLQEEDPSVYSDGTVRALPPPSAGFASNPYEAPVPVTPSLQPVVIPGDDGSAVDGINVKFFPVTPNVASAEVRWKKIVTQSEPVEGEPLPEYNPATEAFTATSFRPMQKLAFYPSYGPGEEQLIVFKGEVQHTIYPVQSLSNYLVEIRLISIYGVDGPWVQLSTLSNNGNAETTDRIYYPEVADPLNPANDRPRIPVTDLRPAQAGADVTSLNTSFNTLNVAAMSAIQLVQDLIAVQYGLSQVVTDYGGFEEQITNVQTSLQASINAAKAELESDLAGAQSTLDAAIDAVDARVDGVQSIVTDHTSLINGKASQSSLNLQISRIDGHDGLISSLQSTVADFPNQYASASVVSSIQSEIQGARNGSANLGAQLLTMRNTVTDGLAGKASTSSLQVERSRIDSLDGSFGTLSSIVSSHTTTLANLPSQYTSASTFNTLNSEITAARNGSPSLSSQLSAMRQTVVDGLAGKASVSSVDSMNLTLTDQGTAIGALQTRATTLEGQMSGKVAITDFNTLSGTVTGLGNTVSGHTTQLTQINLDIAGKASASAFNTLNTFVGGLNTTVAAHATQITQLNSDVAGKADLSNFNTLSSTVTGLNTTVGGHSTQLTQINLDLAGKASVSQLETLQGGVSWLSGRVDGQDISLTQINTSLTGKADLSSFNTLRGEVELARNGKTTLSGELTTMRQAVIDGLSGKVALSDFNTLSGTVGTQGSTISGHNSRLNAVELSVAGKASATSVTTLESKVDSKNRSFRTWVDAPTNPMNGLPLTFGDIWIKASANNEFYFWNGSQWDLAQDQRGAEALSEVIAARAGQVSLSARFTVINNTMVDQLALKASAQSVSDLSVTVGGHTSQITSVQSVANSALGKAEAVVGWNLDVNGKAIGLKFANDGTTGALDILTDYVTFRSSATTGQRIQISGNTLKGWYANNQQSWQLG